MATIIKTGGGYSVGYDDGYSDGYSAGYSTAHGKMKVSQIAAYGGGDSYSETIDTGGTSTKKIYYILTGIKEYSQHDVYIRLLGSNDNSSWSQIVRANAFPGAYSDYGKVGKTDQSYRYYRIHCHRQSGGDRVGGMLAVMAE